MLKSLNVIFISLFMLVASLAPYASANGAALACSQNPEERDLSTPILEEEIHTQEIVPFFIKTVIHDLVFPFYIDLKPQPVFEDILRPPVA